ncbi:Magnesium transporter MgtE [Myxococcaceae bacterium]|jgi:magnesium transporter|nr:Magnesium transporter MgtE [Myxococcaceae bacterium]
MSQVGPSIESTGLLGEELLEAWAFLSTGERVEGFRLLPPDEAEEFFVSLAGRDQADLLAALGRAERQIWLRQLAPDDAADVVQASSEAAREDLLALLDEVTRKEVAALLAYAEDDAGGLMSPRFARVRPDMRVDEAIAYLRRQARERLETIYYIYVLDGEQRLLGVVSFRDLFGAPADRTVREVMQSDPIRVPEDLDQESVSQLIAEHDLMAMPVVDADGRMKGIITVDDIVDVVQEEATEDIQKLGGTAALDAPYLDVGVAEMVRKRGGWLLVLFVGQLFTATAMAHYETELARALVLALFLPLVISSGGNSGSQASTLVIRAITLGEVKLRDWWRVLRREIASGLALGTLLGVFGVLRIVLWPSSEQAYGPHYGLVGLAVGFSLVGIVLWGAVAGAMLPFLLRRLGLDPAAASAPFVATLVDVTGLMIYFNVAAIVLGGTLL